MSEDNDTYAFPGEYEWNEPDVVDPDTGIVHSWTREKGRFPGMTLRDYFAGQALAGLCAHSGSYGASNGPGDLSERSYVIADAMLEARK